MKKPLPPFIEKMMAAKAGAKAAPKAGKAKMAKAKPFSQGGSASSRADGKAIHGKTLGTIIAMKRGGGCK